MLSDATKLDAFQRAVVNARCLVWQATVYERPYSADTTNPLYDEEKGTYLHWDIQLFASEKVLSWLPLTQEDGPSFTQTLNSARFPEEQAELDRRAIEALKTGQSGYSQSFRVRLPRGNVRWLTESVEIRPRTEGIWELTGICVDITEQREAEERLQQVLTHAHCLLWYGRVRLVQDAPPTFDWQITTFDETAARRWLPIKHGEENDFASDYYLCRPEFYQHQSDAVAAEALLRGSESYRHEFPVTLEDGTSRWLAEDVQITPLQPGQWSLVGVCTDITALRQSEERLLYLAEHDPITRLPNRIALQTRLRQLGSQKVALLFLDLDNFKVINDSLGHSVGDAVLVEVAQRLQQVAASTTQVVRLGGDEFTLLLPHTTGVLAAQAQALAERVLSVLQQPISVAGRTLSLGASIGIVLGTGEDPERLLQSGDMAMYEVKNHGKAGLAFFDPEMAQRAKARFELEEALREALENHQLEAYYQPLIHLRSRAPVGFEALARWRHPTLGMIPPSQFIQIAEETGLIVALGEQVLYQACSDAMQWGPRFARLGVQVNVSARQLQPEFVARLAEILKTTHLAPERLTLELTENVLLHDLDQTRSILRELTRLGINLAIDDFGTGYSSLAYLSKMPVQALKIDRSFVEQLRGTRESIHDNQAIIRSVVALGQVLRMEVVAEGIETAQQAAIVEHLGCQLGQGYYWARPLPACEALAWLSPQARAA